jgi:hypothetical protein
LSVTWRTRPGPASGSSSIFAVIARRSRGVSCCPLRLVTTTRTPSGVSQLFDPGASRSGTPTSPAVIGAIIHARSRSRCVADRICAAASFGSRFEPVDTRSPRVAGVSPGMPVSDGAKRAAGSGNPRLSKIRATQRDDRALPADRVRRLVVVDDHVDQASTAQRRAARRDDVQQVSRHVTWVCRGPEQHGQRYTRNVIARTGGKPTGTCNQASAHDYPAAGAQEMRTRDVRQHPRQ